MPPSALLNVPPILQLPELPRGCEVTALAVVLQYYNIHADKEQLAQEVKHDHTPSGEIQITMQEHTMVIVGYDADFIYCKDLLNRKTQTD